MMQDPKVSVVMSVYNADEFLLEAVSSILNQTFSDFEFIIIDDGSTDNSGGILDEFAHTDNRIRLFHQENRGLAASLNTGIEQASGKYIARMDADDISLPDRLAKQVVLMDENPEVGLCGTACRLFGDSNGASWTAASSEENKSRLLFWPCFVHPTVMMRRQLILSQNLFYDPNFKQAEDYELWTRFCTCSEMVNLPDVLFLYRTRHKQATAMFEDDVAQWSLLAQKNLLKNYQIEPTEQELELHLSLHKSRFELSREYVDQVEDWLCKLYDANYHTKLRNPDVFISVLFERWCAVCAADLGLGFWVWKKFMTSRLYSLARDVSDQSNLLIVRPLFRAAFSKGLNSTKSGRWMKRMLVGARQ